MIAEAQNLDGKQPPAMPQISGPLAASYDIDLGVRALTPWVQFIYCGEMWARIFNEPALDKVPAYGVTNVNIAFRPAGRPNLRLSLAGTNLFNVAGVNSQYTDPYGMSQTSRQYIAPRQIVGSLSFSF